MAIIMEQLIKTNFSINSNNCNSKLIKREHHLTIIKEKDRMSLESLILEMGKRQRKLIILLKVIPQ